MLKFLIPAIVIAMCIAGALLFLPESEIADRNMPPQQRERTDLDGEAASTSASGPRTETGGENSNANADDEAEAAEKMAASLQVCKLEKKPIERLELLKIKNIKY